MRSLLLLMVALACTPANAAPTAPHEVPKLVLTIAPGDTARFAFSHTAGARATGSLRSVRVVTTWPTASSWTGLPTDVPGPAAGTYTGLAVSATADSADFVAAVIWTNSGGRSVEVLSNAARWRRRPGAGSVTWDSVTAVLLIPDSSSARAYAPGDGTAGVINAAGLATTQRQLCPVALFGSTAAMPTGYASLPACTQAYGLALAANGWFQPDAAQQQLVDGACWTMTTSAGTFVAPGLWQARRYTAAELGATTVRRETATVEELACGVLPPGTTVGRALYLDGRILALRAWLTVTG